MRLDAGQADELSLSIPISITYMALVEGFGTGNNFDEVERASP